MISLDNKKAKIILSVIIGILLILISVEICYIIKKSKTISSVKSELGQNKTIETSATSENNEVGNTIGENKTKEENKKEENKEEENKAKQNNTTSGTRYKLEINCQQNVINVYEKDKSGKYTKCIKAMTCSTGYATPASGTYYLKKYSGWEWKGLFGDVYGQYTTQVVGNILLHSVPYTRKYDKSSLEYWEYDKLGTAASMGCIRLTVANARWIFYNCEAGTPITFYRNSNPGPLGKPTTQKISSEAKYRGWDPTDPDPKNPWNNYNKPKPPKTETNVIENKVPDNNGVQNDINEINNTIENEVNEVENNTIANDVNEVENNTDENDVNDAENNTDVNDVNEVENNTDENDVNEVENNTIENDVNETENNINNINENI